MEILTHPKDYNFSQADINFFKKLLNITNLDETVTP